MFKKLGIKLPYDPAIPLLGIYLRKPKFKKTTNNKVGEDVETREPLCNIGGSVYACQTLWKTVWRILKKVKIVLSYTIIWGNSGKSVRVYFLGL